MALSIKNCGYAFLIRLDLMRFFVIVKGVPIITNFKRPIKHLIKLIFYENYVKLLKFKRTPL